MKPEAPERVPSVRPSAPGPTRDRRALPRNHVLVVIPTLNEARNIARVVEELHQELPDDADVRFVVCDGSSSDGTAQIVRELSDRYGRLSLQHNPNRLQSAAVNLALRECSFEPDVLVRCDAHAHYPRGFVRSLLQSMRSNDADAIVVPMDSVGVGCLQSAVAWTADSFLGSGGAAHRAGRRSGFVDHGHHAAFRVSSFVRAGGYDESFSHNEDAELDCRQRKLNARIFLDAGIRIHYMPRNSWAALWRQYFSYGKGRSRTVRRHPESLRLRQLAVPVHVAVCTVGLAAAPWTPWGLVWPGVYAAVLVGFSAVQALKHRSRCGLLGGLVAAVLHVGWATGFAWGLLSRRETRWRAERARPLELAVVRSRQPEAAR